MKKVILKSVKITNFKGIRSLSINFDETEFNIFGDNAKGKTTIFDAVEWVRTGKDSAGSSDFEIKPLNNNNQTTQQTDNEVEVVYSVDGDEVKFRRVLTEKWTKKKGNDFQEFTGNETKYYWNDVPKSMAEFNIIFSNIIPESIYRFITNPLAFNNEKMLPWVKRREMLSQLSPTKSLEELANGNPEFLTLISKLTQGKTLEEYKKQISASITKIKHDLTEIPPRIDEAERGKPEVFDFDSLSLELKNLEDKLSKIESSLLSESSKYDDLIRENGSIRVLESELSIEISRIENTVRNEINVQPVSKSETLKRDLETAKLELKSFENAIVTLETNITLKKNEILNIDNSIAEKRNQWSLENGKEFSFDELNTSCPTCKQDLPNDEIESSKESLRSRFIQNKSENIKSIIDVADNMKAQKQNLESELIGFEERIKSGLIHVQTTKEKIDNIESEIVAYVEPLKLTDEEIKKKVENHLIANADYQSKKEELKLLPSKIKSIPEVDNSDLINQKNSISFEIDTVKSKLNNKSLIENINVRICQLKEQEETLSFEISSVEKEHFLIEKLNKLRIESIESEVNSKFSIVKFKMFELQVNGGENECCKAMVNGVPFSDLNTASKINAGLDIINTLCTFHQVSAPIFIDNRESIVNTIPVVSQLINLNVLEGAKLSFGKPEYTEEYLKLHPNLNNN